MTSNVDRYWQQFLDSLPAQAPRPERYLEAFHFGFDASDAAAISPLVLAGIKTATGSVLWSLEADGKTPPRAGDYSIVTNGGDDPVCIIETTDVRVLPFAEVPARYAWEGGEGDRSVESWRAMYWAYIESECRRIGREPSPLAPLVMERFRVVYAAPLEPRGAEGSALLRR